MQENPKISDMIYALRETDRSEGYFSPLIETTGLTWNFKISDFDKLGLLILHLDIKAKDTPALPLEKQSEVLKEKLTYLEEDFKLVEYDRNNRTVILRSNLFHRMENSVNYYEIVLKEGNQLSFDCYELDRTGGKRQICPTNLARATFERLLADFDNLLS
ncbi:MAG: hypothetical protein DMG06_07975 [Acidobacteria bacterium]|nr:MAG: hypothetical protein DMG06_07975 [Acidobacteriota bacterium]